jgi:hypothetical protein
LADKEVKKEEGRRKKEEGRRKKEEGRKEGRKDDKKSILFSLIIPHFNLGHFLFKL